MVIISTIEETGQGGQRAAGAAHHVRQRYRDETRGVDIDEDRLAAHQFEGHLEQIGRLRQQESPRCSLYIPR